MILLFSALSPEEEPSCLGLLNSAFSAFLHVMCAMSSSFLNHGTLQNHFRFHLSSDAFPDGSSPHLCTYSQIGSSLCSLFIRTVILFNMWLFSQLVSKLLEGRETLSVPLVLCQVFFGLTTVEERGPSVLVALAHLTNAHCLPGHDPSVRPAVHS